MSDVYRDTWPEEAADERPTTPPSVGRALPAERADLLTFPRVPGRLVPRPDQLRRLDRLAPLTVIEALPGLGKTTLAATWAKAHLAAGNPAVWIRAAAEVDDPEAFLQLLCHGLVSRGVLTLAPEEPCGRSLMSAWVEDLAHTDRPVLVVVDDAHTLRDPAVADALVRLVRRAPTVHVAVVAEGRHEFRDAAARHSLESNILRGGHLAVAADEVADFAEAWGHSLPPDAGRRLYELVGGWLLPLRLVLDATPSWSAGFATHVAEDFMLSRVLPAIPATGDLSLAMRLAVPERLDLRVAAVLAGGGDGTVAVNELAGLEHEGLLWRTSGRDGRAEWRYPQLLRRTLLEELARREPRAASTAHRAVAHALVSEPGSTRSGELLRHARWADDWRMLADLWVDRGWPLLGGEPEAFEFAYSAVPGSVLVEHPSLTLPATLADALATGHGLGAMERVEFLLRHYAQAATDFLRRREPASDPTHLAEMLTAAMVARRSEGHLHEARQLAAEAGRELSRGRLADPHRPRTSQVAWFHLQNAITQVQADDCGRAFEAATAAYQVRPDSLVGAAAAGLLAVTHAVSGHHGEALRWLANHESVDLSGKWAAGLAELPGRLARAMLALDRLDAAAAAAELAEAPIGPESHGLWPLIVLVHARYELLFGDPAGMLFHLEHLRRVLTRHVANPQGVGRQVLDHCAAEMLLALGEVNRFESRLEPDTDLPPWLTAPAARFHLITGNPAKAARLAVAGTWRDDVHVRSRLELLTISAVAWRALGEADRARESFRRAHTLTAETGIHQPWLLLPPTTRRELLDVDGLEFDAGIAAVLAGDRRVYPEDADLVRLSQRELEVLRQMPHHDTAAALAKTLSVSVNTVKKQMISLYGKLGVHDRSAAILRAQRLGLIDDPREPRSGGPTG